MESKTFCKIVFYCTNYIFYSSSVNVFFTILIFFILVCEILNVSKYVCEWVFLTISIEIYINNEMGWNKWNKWKEKNTVYNF